MCNMYIYIVVLYPLMLNAKFNIHEHGGHLGHVTQFIYDILSFPLPIDARNKCLTAKLLGFGVGIFF